MEGFFGLFGRANFWGWELTNLGFHTILMWAPIPGFLSFIGGPGKGLGLFEVPSFLGTFSQFLFQPLLS